MFVFTLLLHTVKYSVLQLISQCEVLRGLIRINNPYKCPHSLRDIVNQFGNIINLATLSCQVKGLPSAKEVGCSRTKLKAKEEIVLVKQLIFMGACGFPHSQKTAHEEATKILQARCE
jgi:hypothetical protein